MARTGRPSKYPKGESDELCRKVIECGQQGMSEVEIAVELGVPRRTMQSWGDQHDEFSAALSRAKEASQAWWERQARAGNIGNLEGQVNPAAWKHSMSCRFRSDYGEKTEHVLTGKDGGPIKTEDIGLKELARRLAYVLAKGANDVDA